MAWPVKFYFVAASAEGPQMASDIEKMNGILEAKGHHALNRRWLIQREGDHKEWFWKREFPAAYLFLFDFH